MEALVGLKRDGNMSLIVNASGYRNETRSLEVMATLTVIYSVILVIGCIGNISVIWVTIRYCPGVRTSGMNIYIMNMAVADLMLTLSAVPDVAQFLIDDGWLLGMAACKILRYIMVMSLYVSILSLLTVTMERSVAILAPLKAHSFLTKDRIVIAVGSIWFISITCSLPIAVFNEVEVVEGGPLSFCKSSLPQHIYKGYKFAEFAMYYAMPLLGQIIMYILISRRLNKSTEILKKSIDTTAQVSLTGSAKVLKPQSKKSRKFNRMFPGDSVTGRDTSRSNNTVESRRRVVRMLTACVTVYFVSYTPAQVMLWYETISGKPFQSTWLLKSALYTLGYINAAANPIIYCIFSASYRQKFAVMYGCTGDTKLQAKRLKQTDSTGKSGGSMRTLSTGVRAEANMDAAQELHRADEDTALRHIEK